MDKNEIIKKIYFDPAGYGSIDKTYKEAKEKDKSIKLNDVKEWFNKNVEKRTQLKGYNSFINDKAYDEYEIDLVFFKNKNTNKTEIGLVILDIFTKYAVVIPIESKETPDVIAGVMEGINKMGHKPNIIYSDNEGALKSNLFDDYCKENNIKIIFTRTHAWAVERFIRTLRDKINKRIDNNDKNWKDVLYEVLLTYNNKDVHSSHGLTPNEARKDSNRLQVKLNLEMHRVSKRKYPDLDISDNVKIYKKKGKFDKEFKSVWLPEIHKIKDIELSFGQKHYYIDGFKRPFLRHELLKINN